MDFDYNNYRIDLLFGPLVSLLLAVLIILFIGRSIYLKKDLKIKMWRFWILVSVAVTIGGLIVYDASYTLKYGIHLIYEQEVDLVQNAGTIEDIQISDRLVVHSEIEGKTSLKIVTIEGEKYLFVSVSDLNIGDNVIIEYLPKSRVVLEWYMD